MLAAALLPYIAALSILSFYGKSTIKQGLESAITIQNANAAKEIGGYFSSLSLELKSMAKIEIMDDALTGDIDKRISSLLLAKKQDRKLKGELLCLNSKGLVVASTSKAMQGGLLKEDIKNGSNELRLIDSLGYEAFIVSEPISASFDKEMFIGRLIMVLKTDNFTPMLISDREKESFLFNSKTKKIISNTIVKYDGDPDKSISEDGSHITSSQKIDSIKDWYVITQSDKESAFATLDRFILLLTIALFVGALLIVVASLILSSKVIRPITQLSKIAEAIGKERSFDKRAPVESNDEIGVLSMAFNRMADDIEHSLEEIKKENEERLRLFVALVEMFKKITASTSETETVETAISQIGLFWPNRLILFKNRQEDCDKESFALYGVSFDDEERRALGYICVEGLNELSVLERQFFHSILEMVELQIERIALWQKTEAASKAKSDFIANMSHELRTPLNSVIGFSQFLASLDDFPKEYANIPKNIETAGRHLLGLINDILDMAKIEAGKIEVYKEPIEPMALISELQAIAASLIASKNIAFSTDIRLQSVFISDSKLLKQILLNLLSNAIKFTEEGSVSLAVAENKENIEFIVKDSGIGLSREDISRLFKDFTQIENPLQKKYKGTGLGLSLCRKFAVYLDGSVTIASEGVGKGSEAILTIPKGKL